jgi:23S rRNA pseudouridine2604 synthase
MEAGNEDSISLNKYISSTGLCSRREADALIRQGRASINGTVAVNGNRVFPGDVVTLDGKPLRDPRERPVYIALHKPTGITCTTERHIKGNIIDFVGHPRRIFPVGRLDKDSEGLILLTSDGDIVNKILRAGNRHEKEYLVTVDKPITRDFLHQMRSGVPILDTVTKPCKVFSAGPKRFRIILVQGLNRQIRRMCAYLGYEVQALQRTRLMHLTLENLPYGQWRNLSAEEVKTLFALIEGSSKTEEASK